MVMNEKIEPRMEERYPRTTWNSQKENNCGSKNIH